MSASLFESRARARCNPAAAAAQSPNPKNPNPPPNHPRLIAHGKKVARVRLAGVRLRDICEAILSPQVPHSLRLQGILVSGVCVVFQRQQAFLLGELVSVVVLGW